MRHYHNNNKNLHSRKDDKEFVVTASLAIGAGVAAIAGGAGLATAGLAATSIALGGSAAGIGAVGFGTAAVAFAGMSYGIYAGGKAIWNSMMPDSPNYNPEAYARQLAEQSKSATAKAEAEAKLAYRKRQLSITNTNLFQNNDEALVETPTLLGA